RSGGNRNVKRTALAGGRSNQGCAVRALAGLIPVGLGLVVAMTLSMPAQSQGKQLAQANAALQAGEADKALPLLEPLAQPGGEAEAYNLRCRVEYTLEQWDRATSDCEQA